MKPARDTGVCEPPVRKRGIDYPTPCGPAGLLTLQPMIARVVEIEEDREILICEVAALEPFVPHLIGHLPYAALRREIDPQLMRPVAPGLQGQEARAVQICRLLEHPKDA